MMNRAVLCWAFVFWNVFLAVERTHSFSFGSEVTKCCMYSSSLTCRKICQKIPPGKIASRQIQVLLETCKKSEISFWTCLNATIRSFGGSMSQKSCCLHTNGVVCQLACYFAQSKRIFNRLCDLESKTKLERCIGRMQVSSLCCMGTEKIACYYSCVKIFSTDSLPGSAELQHMKLHCSDTPFILQCVQNFTNNRYSDLDFRRCCDYSDGPQCKRTCTDVMHRQITFKERFGKLMKDCGFPLPQDKLWGCLLKLSAGQGHQRKLEDKVQGLNFFKDHCCLLASTRKCKTWCSQVFQNPSLMTHFDSSYMDCMESPAEKKLSVCVADVLQPCKFGCEKKMSFCSGFSNRPLQLYRRCNSAGDNLARKLFASWSSGTVEYRSLKLAIKDIRRCKPDLWKAVACTLALQPCSRGSSGLQICWNQCVDLLKSCLNKGKSNSQKSPEELCSLLVPESKKKECFVPDAAMPMPLNPNFKFTTPCQPNPCEDEEVCVKNTKCKDNKSCSSFRCVKGCALVKSAIRVQRGNYIKLNYPGNKGKCQRICRCNDPKQIRFGKPLVQCLDVGCTNQRSCYTKDGVFGHGNAFFMECNYCTCFEGRVICTTKTCHNSVHESGLPCGCDNTYNTVCTASGMTFSNLCLARCAGVEDDYITAGDCQSIPPCQNRTCPIGFKCTPYSSVCLEKRRDCQQHKCEATYPPRPPKTQLEVKPAPCSNEKEVPQVCGMDGATYKDRSVAEEAMVPVDYPTPCVHPQEQLQNDLHRQRRRCKNAACEDTNTKGCIPYFAPLTCCGVCGGVVRALFSNKDLEDHNLLIDSKPITIKDVLSEVQQLVFMSHCEVRGYPSAEGDLIIVIQPTYQGAKTDTERSLQLEACHLETERITGLFHLQSPLVTTNYYLSIIKAVRRESKFDKSSGRPAYCNLGLVQIITLSIILSLREIIEIL